MINFGTDGVRGVANQDLTPENAFALGRATTYVLAKDTGKAPVILIGKDTRISCNMLEAAFTAGVCSVGGSVHLAGVVPTPAIATSVAKQDYDAGVMISASHNPVADNGIKLFNAKGYKLDDSIEEAIIAAIEGNVDMPRPTGADVGTSIIAEGVKTAYLETLLNSVAGVNLSHLRVGIDCANGATYRLAEKALVQLGATVLPIHNTPNGVNINDNCGSTHMDDIVAHVKTNKLDIGIAFDGDGDRCLIVDELGNILDGDQIMSMVANHLKYHGKLAHNTLVSTIMSNIGLDQMGTDRGINIVRAKVGDRYVLEQMLAGGYNFGGEQSGHFIFLDHTTTGDGTLTALQILQLMANTGKPLSQIDTHMTVHPQVTVGAIVNREKKDTFAKNPTIAAAIKTATDKYTGTGRVLVRASGTESMVRVTIEGADLADITATANELKTLLEQELN